MFFCSARIGAWGPVPCRTSLGSIFVTFGGDIKLPVRLLSLLFVPFVPSVLSFYPLSVHESSRHAAISGCPWGAQDGLRIVAARSFFSSYRFWERFWGPFKLLIWSFWWALRIASLFAAALGSFLCLLRPLLGPFLSLLVPCSALLGPIRGS